MGRLSEINEVSGQTFPIPRTKDGANEARPQTAVCWGCPVVHRQLLECEAALFFKRYKTLLVIRILKSGNPWS